MNNYWTQAIEPTGTSCANRSLLDLWLDDAPAVQLAGKGRYIEDIFQDAALAAIANFSAQRAAGGAQRLYLDYRPHSQHWPLMVDEAAFNNHSWVTDDEAGCRARFYGDAPWPGAPDTAFSCRRLYQAMLSNLDARIGQVVDALTAAGLYSETLITLMADNGGCVSLSENAGNNWPLRSGKYHPFEGGVRVSAMWGGGYLPPAARGTTSHGLVHIADYYMTLCLLAGLPAAECARDDLAAAAGLPPIDSLDVWPLVVEGGAPVRNEVPVGPDVLLKVDYSTNQWWKLFTSPRVPGAGWTGPIFPNSTSPDPEAPVMECAKGGCLFDVMADPGERNDVAAQHPQIVATLTARLAELSKSFYSKCVAPPPPPPQPASRRLRPASPLTPPPLPPLPSAQR